MNTLWMGAGGKGVYHLYFSCGRHASLRSELGNGMSAEARRARSVTALEGDDAVALLLCLCAAAHPTRPSSAW